MADKKKLKKAQQEQKKKGKSGLWFGIVFLLIGLAVLFAWWIAHLFMTGIIAIPEALLGGG